MATTKPILDMDTYALLVLMDDLLTSIFQRVGYEGYADEIFELVKMIRMPYWSRIELTVFMSKLQDAMHARGHDVNIRIERPSCETYHPLWVHLDHIEDWFDEEAARLAAGGTLCKEGLVNVIHKEFSQHHSPFSKSLCTMLNMDFKLQGEGKRKLQEDPNSSPEQKRQKV